MDNPAYRQEMQRRLHEEQLRKEAQRAADPAHQILMEVQRRKAYGMGPEGTGEAGARNAEINRHLQGAGGGLGGGLPPTAPPAAGNPFANESQEFQEMMRRLGVIQ
jgi:hypothetical protein